MATYHQYSEIVAAYGYRLPPPPQPQASRVGLALLYAAVGVALGTFTGTALAVATLPPEAAMLPHISFARSIHPQFHIHAIANAGQKPVIQNHAAMPMASAAVPPAVSAPAISAATPIAAVNHASNASTAPALFLHQVPALPSHAAGSIASTTTAPAADSHAFKNASSLSSTVAPEFLIHQPPVFHARPFAPFASSSPAPVVLSRSVILASNAGQPQILNLAPIVHAAAAAHAQTLKPATAVSSQAQITAAEPLLAAPQPVQKQASSDNMIAVVAPIASPLAATAQPQPPAAPPAAALPSASLSAGLDGSFKPLTFYSEGDATVVSYDAAGDTITTDDGRTFAIGTTVSASNAVSWQDYRSNVHYRCDQNGNCSLVRTGVIALNAKLL